MEFKTDLFNYLMKSTQVVLLFISIALTSCTGKLFVASIKAEDRTRHLQSFNRSKYGAQNTLSPYTKEYKAYLQRKYFGNEMKKESKTKRVLDNMK